jgi:hypothetical protein
MTERKGPLESRKWPDALEAFALDPASSPRLHGYDVEADLVRHYRFSDLVFVSLTGELPDDHRSRAFEIALSMSLPSSVRDAATHAAVLAAHCGARPGGLLATSVVASADATTAAIEAFRAVLEQPPAELPDELRAQSEHDVLSVERLRQMVSRLVDVPLLFLGPRRDLALLAVFWACGLRTSLQLVSAAVIARLPSAIAEATPRVVEDFSRYPTDTPPFIYED